VLKQAKTHALCIPEMVAERKNSKIWDFWQNCLFART